jgi:phosphatidylglycerol:prolipoprotein diacylglycerol transferase
MIPYLPQPRFHVVGLTFYAFGILAAAAVLIGGWMILRRSQRTGLPRAVVEQLTFYSIFWGFCGSHVLYMLCSQPAALARHPLRLFNPLDGIYSFGGIVSGLVALVWFARRYQLTRMQFWRYLDAFAFVFPFAWTLARTGCFLAHDHIGQASTSWIAVRFPDGPHLDLGLIEVVFTASVAAGFLLLDRIPRPAPFFCGIWFLLYGPFRVWMNTLQQSSERPDLFFGGAAFAFGCAMLILAWRHRSPLRPAA